MPTSPCSPSGTPRRCRPPAVARSRDHPAYLNDPWAPAALERLALADGARGGAGGHRADDGRRRDHPGLTPSPGQAARRIAQRAAASGAHPGTHRPAGCGEIAFDPDASLPEHVDAILAASAGGGRRWHQLVDELRPRTQALWKRLSTEERAHFLATRHRAWCVRRHRMPPQVAAALAQLIGDRSLEVRSGHVELAAAGAGALEAHVSGARVKRRSPRDQLHRAGARSAGQRRPARPAAARGRQRSRASVGRRI